MKVVAAGYGFVIVASLAGIVRRARLEAVVEHPTARLWAPVLLLVALAARGLWALVDPHRTRPPAPAVVALLQVSARPSHRTAGPIAGPVLPLFAHRPMGTQD